MSTFFRSSTVWAVDYTFDGHPRRWLRALPAGVDAAAWMQAALADLHGARARLVRVHPATAEEEAQYLRDEQSPAPMCPTGRRGTGPA